MIRPLVSCIVPMYNSESTIFECLSSLVSINYRPMEIIIVDDGSTDQSIDAVDGFMENFDGEGIEFVVLTNDLNKGISYAKNQGMLKMQGEFFFFAASDDIQLTNRISLPLGYLQQNSEIDIVYLDCDLWHFVSKDNNITRRGFPSSMTNENAFLYQVMRSYFWSGLVFARKKAVLEFDESLSSAVDYDWYFRQYFLGRKIHFLDVSVMKYRLHNKNTSKKLTESSANVVKILQKYDFQKMYQDLCQKDPSDLLHLSFAQLDFTLSRFDQSLAKLSCIKIPGFEGDFMNGVLHAQLNDFGNSEVIFERLCKENPNKPECFNNLAVCIIHNSKNKTYATELLEKAIRLNRNYLDAQKNFQFLKNPSVKTNNLLITKRPLREVLTHIDSYE
jgi:glycosyltransferase involved in cell wall biosynthesis